MSNRQASTSSRTATDVKAAALNAANVRLQTLRAQQQQTATMSQVRANSINDVAAQPFPSHLGWATAALRRAVSVSTNNVSQTSSSVSTVITNSAENTSPPIEKPQTIKVYPSILTAMLRQEQAAIGRIWLLCRALDQNGQGWLTIDELRAKLTDKASDWRIVGWRRLRQLLQKGREVFWKRDEFGRIWLYGTARVAQNLKVVRLVGNPINITMTSLIAGLQETKAAFYAAFHAGRKTNNPISRASLTKETGASESTQRSYEISGNISASKNYCVSNLSYTPENIQAEAYKRPIVFAYQDHKTGQKLIAWPLPNRYESTLSIACHGRQRKINRQLKSTSDLVIQGRGGTGADFGRIFCAHGQQAMQCSQNGMEYYWQSNLGRWHPIKQ